MSMPLPTSNDWPGDVIYPESDGKPMAESPQQGRVIRLLVCGFRRLYGDRPDMFVDGDFFWYPVQGEPSTVAVPDVTIIDQLVSPIDVTTMGSYRQWIFGGRVLLAIEVLSPSNTWAEMARKLNFYQRHGVQEYWVFDPADGALEVHVREGGELRKLGDPASGLISATTGVHVHVEGKDLVVADPDGRRWLSPEDEAARADALAARADALAAEVATLRQRLGDVDPLPD